MTEVAVIIPTHDRAELVCRAVESVLAQTLAASEIVVVDDGSSDDTVLRLEQRFGFEASLRILSQENRGVSAARNLGVLATTAPLIAFLDSDDVWHSSKLQVQLGELAGERRQGRHFRLCHTNEIWIREGNQVRPRERHRKASGSCFEHCLELCAISPSSVLLERSLLTEVGLFDESLPACEDYDLWLRISAREPVLLIEQELVTKYGGHEDQLSRRFHAMDRFRIRSLEGLLDRATLTDEQRRATAVELARKLDIYRSGCERRGKTDQVEWCLEIASRTLATHV